MATDNYNKLTRRHLFTASAALSGSAMVSPAFAAGSDLRAEIDVSNTGTEINPMIYGGFIEHIGNLINHSLWSEVLDDRKFYFNVLEKPEEKPTEWRAAMRFMQKWFAIGPLASIKMNRENAYVGEHSPEVQLNGEQVQGIAQQGLALKSGLPYTGRIVLRSDPGVKVSVKLIWGAGEGQSQVNKISGSRKWKTRNFSFDEAGDTTDARFEILAEGKGSFGIGAVSLMPADNIQGFRSDIVALMKEVNCPILRMPGGNFVSAYDWKDTIGAPDLRPPILDPVWSSVQPNDVGIDELLQFCELIGTEPFWCVNTGFGEPRSGAECVEYVNGSVDTRWGALRVANGRKTPYDVKYWAIGNEMYGHWQRGHMSRDHYTVKHNLFADAMRAVDPDIYIVAPGGFVDEMTTGQGIFIAGQPEVKVGSERDWAFGMFKDSWGKFDAVGTHAYPPANKRFNLSTGKLDDVEKPLNEWARQPADRIRTMVDAWEQYKQHFPKLNDGDIKVFFDEWAFHFQDDLKGSLAIAMAFHEFFRHTDFIAMAGFTMASAWLNFDRTDSIISIKGEMFKFYHERFGSIPVEVGGNSPMPAPQYPIGGDQPSVNPGSPTYPLDVSAALTKDGKTLTIAVVNPNEKSHELELNFQNFSSAVKGQCWKFTGTSKDAQNALGKAPQALIENSEFDASKGSLAIAPISVEIYHFKRLA